MDIIASFFDTLYDMFTSGWWGIIAGSLVVLMLLIIIGLIAWGIFIAADSWCLPVKQGSGLIKGWKYYPAHYQPITTTTTDANGKVSSSTTMVYIPDSWSVTVRMGNRTASMGCSKGYYDNAKKDQPVTVHYVDGRFSSKFYIKSLS